jgi:beta-aspartyl-peptidase (threonine type)
VIAIVVHGGVASHKKREIQREGVVEAVRAGYEILKQGGSAIDAVENAVVLMEEDPVFNAGTGSALGLDGQAEMDASIMSDDLECGAVAAIKWVRNPVKVARCVMEKTDHILLAGEGATRFAWMMGFECTNVVTEERKRMLAEGLAGLAPDHPYFPRMKGFLRDHSLGTVGSVAVDEKRRVAAATSTGGMNMNLPGRVGDSAIIGAGTYVDRRGGASAMGHGECILKIGLARAAVENLEQSSAQEAAAAAISAATGCGCSSGVIVVDRSENVGIAFNTEGMAYASMCNGRLDHF